MSFSKADETLALGHHALQQQICQSKAVLLFNLAADRSEVAKFDSHID